MASICWLGSVPYDEFGYNALQIRWYLVNSDASPIQKHLAGSDASGTHISTRRIPMYNLLREKHEMSGKWRSQAYCLALGVLKPLNHECPESGTRLDTLSETYKNGPIIFSIWICRLRSLRSGPRATPGITASIYYKNCLAALLGALWTTIN